MKMIDYFTRAAAVVCMLGVTNCTSMRIGGKIVEPVDIVQKKGDTFTDGRGEELYTGFIGDNRYRTVACGTPRAGSKDVQERRESALREAMIRARMSISDVFDLSTIAHGGYLSDMEEFREYLPYMQSVLKEGTVIAKSFNADDACCLVYQVEGKELKDKPAYIRKSFRLKNIFMSIRSGTH
jgi:hypothetical protein